MPNLKIIERIKKLLELASSANESDNERMLAMSRAQEMMLKYSLDENELIDNATASIINVPYTSEIFLKQGVLQVLPQILAIIPPIFGCYAIVQMNAKRHPTGYNLIGFPNNVEIAKFAVDSLLTQGLITAREEYKKFRTITFGLSFWTGYAKGLTEKFASLGNHDEKGLELYDKVKQYMHSLTTDGGFGAEYNDGAASQIGYSAGLKAEIRNAIGMGNEGKLIQ